MKKIVMTLMAAGLIAAPSLASAETTPYVSLSAGLGLMNDSDIKDGVGFLYDSEESVLYKTGVALEGAVGVKMDMFRVEAAVGYQSSDVDKYEVDGTEEALPEGFEVSTAIRSYMVNGYADFDMNNGITPFVMGGVGLANVDLKMTGTYDDSSVSLSFSQDVFAWQVGAGVGVKATDNITVDLSYRYFATSDVKVASDDDGDAKFTVGTSKVLLGMRYSF
ncbi:outer membrane protein [Chlorobium phaeovibrioides]|nr:outer membrane beta-barrel protein [Chlorobium phaeovibrioides]